MHLIPPAKVGTRPAEVDFFACVLARVIDEKAGHFDVFASLSFGSAHLVLDVFGYFQLQRGRSRTREGRKVPLPVDAPQFIHPTRPSSSGRGPMFETE